ncbi:hypothetical protein Y1Q_0012949 [Alligator mississippiensis]|uniref:Uncharacterized protein n=1 Tax=Alligator mississippiensis TaxID=8496 RepID=A0A151P0N9_ALLMI|nr:hypothetical protein Y1Q_0012949 [Alligator mississippiensis]
MILRSCSESQDLGDCWLQMPETLLGDLCPKKQPPYLLIDPVSGMLIKLTDLKEQVQKTLAMPVEAQGPVVPAAGWMHHRAGSFFPRGCAVQGSHRMRQAGGVSPKLMVPTK